MKNNRPEVLIEKWLPIQQLGIESRRENSTGQHPPPNRLHVWWARRPLTVSRAAILASLLPPDVDAKWFLETLGIFGNPVEARRKIEEARRKNIRLPGDLYGYRRAFTFLPTDKQLQAIQAMLKEHWNADEITILDPMAGGGSIPFEARSYGFETYANDLNPIAYIILHATLDYPFRFGMQLADDIQKWGMEIHKRGQKELHEFFPSSENEIILDYIWARTVACPECNLTVPLSPNWWLQKEGNPPKGIAVRLIVPKENEDDRCQFEMVNVGRRSPELAKDYNPNNGTVSRGVGRCPRCGNTLTGDYIKTEAQEGRMGQQLYALVLKEERGRSFRLPMVEDEQAVEAAERRLAEKLPEWEAKEWVPNEPYPEQSTDSRPLY